MPSYAYRGNPGYISAVEGRLADAGFSRVDDVSGAGFVLTFCTSMTVLEDLYFGDEGLVQAADPGTVMIDVSACTPNLAGELSALSAVSDLTMVSAPMVVRNKAASDAFARDNAYCFAGSEGKGVAAAAPLLDVLFGEVLAVDDPGAAQLARAAATMRSTAEIVSAIETVSLFEACSASASSGIDALSLVPEAASSEAASVLKAVRDEDFGGEGGYTVEMLMSELSAAMMAADDYETILPQTEAAFHLYELLAVIGGSDMSPAALALVYEGESGADDADAYGYGEEGCGCEPDECECGECESGHAHSHGRGKGAHGLDWSRVEQLYGSDAADASMDEFAADEGFGPDFADGDPYDDDDFVSGFGYSIN